MFIALPVEVFVERPCKDVIRTDGIEQRHRGTKLERIYAWQYFLNLTAFYVRIPVSWSCERYSRGFFVNNDV